MCPSVRPCDFACSVAVSAWNVFVYPSVWRLVLAGALLPASSDSACVCPCGGCVRWTLRANDSVTVAFAHC